MPILKKFDLIAILLIVITPLLMLETFGYLPGVHNLWPIFPFFLGLGFIALCVQKKLKDIVMLGLGTFLVGISWLFFYLNYSSWRNLADIWPLFIGILGGALGVCAGFGKIKLLWQLSIGLIGLCIIFLLVFSVSSKLWPISLALFGVVVLIINHGSVK